MNNFGTPSLSTEICRLRDVPKVSLTVMVFVRIALPAAKTVPGVWVELNASDASTT